MEHPPYGISPEDENAFHKQRLLPVENRPLRRALDRLFLPTSLIFKSPSTLLANGTADDKSPPEDRAQWKDEMLLELSVLESAMVRIQMLRRSNALECARYVQASVKIQEQSQQIRENTVESHLQFAEAKKTMELRKVYDELTEKITSNRMLRPREDQMAQLEKLSGEIAELEEESQEYKRTWAERREQFGRIVDEGRQMLRLIKDEKEEAERKEGMDGGDDEHDGATRVSASVAPTPRYGGSTPLPGEEMGGTQDRLLPPSFRIASPARSGSRAATPSKQYDQRDVEMADAANTPAAATNVSSEMEEGEAEEDEGMGGVDE